MGFSSYKSSILVMVLAMVVATTSASNFYQDFDITWGDHRAKIINGGQLLSLSLDKVSGSGFQSKQEYLFGRIDMQLKLVAGNSAGTVTAYYVCLKLKTFLAKNLLRRVRVLHRYHLYDYAFGLKWFLLTFM